MILLPRAGVSNRAATPARPDRHRVLAWTRPAGECGRDGTLSTGGDGPAPAPGAAFGARGGVPAG